MKRSLSIIAALFLVTAANAKAEVGFDIHIGNMGPAPAPPPVIVVNEAPTMVFVPQIGFYVAVGIPYDVVYIGNRYYYHHGGAWFVSPYYSGPWVYAGPKKIPPGLRKYKIEKIHNYRMGAWKEYKEHGPAYKEKHFKGKGKPERKDNTGKRGGPGRKFKD